MSGGVRSSPRTLRSGKTVATPEFHPQMFCMKQSDIFRDNAENCLQLAERAEGQPAHKRYSRMADAWTALAHEQDWLDGEIPPVKIRTPQARNA
ncbi:hypothetical protein ACVWY3_004107 [Bradyrhizobium sp. USDA 4486]